MGRTWMVMGFGLSTFWLLASLFSGSSEPVFAEDTLPKRVAGSVELLGEPSGLPEYAVAKAFPEITFERPIAIVCPKDGTGNLFVAEQNGKIKVIAGGAKRKVNVALDLSKKVSREHNEEGVLGFAFHPEFKKNGYAYVAYTSHDPRETVIARFTASSSTMRFLSARTEALVLRRRQRKGSHNGGWIAFGPDSYLYISLGDGGEDGDESGNAQNLGNWLGTILRVDINKGERYAVPQDNPFTGIPNVRDEIYAYGFANVGQFAFDAVTGDLWGGDAGAGAFEEINRIEKGGNYGWNLFEGRKRFREGNSLTPLRKPMVALPAAEARRVVGGVVYRGERLAGLAGAYLFADHASGALYAIRSDGLQVTEKSRIGTVPGITSIGVDGKGELLMTSLDGSIYTLQLEDGAPPIVPFPQRLSQTGLFSDMQTLEPDPSLVPFTVATPLWSDGAGKDRYLMLPGLQKIVIRKDGTYEFPKGTIFVKHFAYGDDLQTGRMLETRLLVKRDSGWAGYTYVWDENRTDAHLIDGRMQSEISTPSGKRSWTFPSRGDCMACHTAVANEVLGFRREQLDVPMSYGQTTMNQLDALEAMGVFEGKNSRKHSWPTWEAEADLDQQVRAYLDSNCAMCHQPDGPGNANIDLRYDTKLKKAGILDKRPGMWNLDVYQARILAPGEPKRSVLYLRMMRTDRKGMPNIAHNSVDEKALQRVEAWIGGMKKMR